MDLGGTKLAVALFSETGEIINRDVHALKGVSGKGVGDLIKQQVGDYLNMEGASLRSVGISVPGISRQATGKVWAPNIRGWEDFPLRKEVMRVAKGLPVNIDSDRACSILGEHWRGNLVGCDDAIYLTVGTGIGAGILTDGRILRGADDIGGAVGWMAMNTTYQKKYEAVGCFEYYGSGDGIARHAKEVLAADANYDGLLRRANNDLTAHHVFSAYEQEDPLATEIMNRTIEIWGRGVSNLISIFNPRKIIFGGGIFGPAVKFIPRIRTQAMKWAQPISAQGVAFEESALEGNAAIFGAGFLALNNIEA